MRGNLDGIFVLPATGTAVATIDQVRLEGGIDGLVVEDNSKVTVRNSIASGNSGIGFVVASNTTAAAELNIENCVASNNVTGILAQSNSTGIATIRVSNSTVTDNGTGLSNFTGLPAVLLSEGNNTVEGNTNNTSGTIGSYAAK